MSAIKGGKYGDFGTDYNWHLNGICELGIEKGKGILISTYKFNCIIKVELDTENNEFVSSIKDNRINIYL